MEGFNDENYNPLSSLGHLDKGIKRTEWKVEAK